MIEMITEHDRKVYREEFAGRLPARIFDSHVHIVCKRSFPPEWPSTNISYVAKTGNEFTVEQFFGLYEKFLPGVEMSLAGFGSPAMRVDRSDAANFGADNKRVFGLRLLSAYDPVEQVEADIRQYRLAGVKPYANMALKTPGREVELLDFFTPEQLEMLNRLKLIAVVHIPRAMRLEDPLNRRQMKHLCEKYPDVTFIFAHIGRAYYQRCATNFVDEFVEFPNAWWDTAMINHEGVLRYTFDHFPAERILFGTDAPIAFLHGKSIEIDNQYAYVTPEDFHSGTVLNDTSGKLQYVPFLYEQLRSVLALDLPRPVLEGFFFNNAHKLYTATVERMYGK
ncbi:MAG: amidohydrolase family protein [Lentisphaeria bacterium]|nr:amidohydrolase family protein [Lentisphaeria bacterium]